MTALLKYDEACRAVAEAKSFDEVRDWEDKAAAVREYTRRIGNREMELDAWEIREHARRRRGELLGALKAAAELSKGTGQKKRSNAPDIITLDDLGITRDESARDQKIAALDGDSFSRLVARCRRYAEDHPEKHSFDVLRPPDEPVHGARSIMGSRQEPDDSLDYFPTPPWATRALIGRVLGRMFEYRPYSESVWEPACGEGHMAEVLREFFSDVFASDIFDYGYGYHGLDFLSDDALTNTIRPSDLSWIITNPPFGEKTEAFVLRALDLATVGVAMFVRLQWLESIGRYENVFKDHPPTLIAFFAERVNLCKGRWEPDGTTATAYIWLVWIKGKEPQAPFWIPPGQREALTKPDDSERFTAHPVIKKSAAPRPLVDAAVPSDTNRGPPDGEPARMPSARAGSTLSGGGFRSPLA